MAQTFKPEKILTEILKPHGFKREGVYWVKETPLHFYFLNLQGSRWGGGDRYVNLCVTFKEFLAEGQTYKNQRQINFRVNDVGLLNGAMTYTKEFIDLTDAEREKRLRVCLESYAVPILNQLGTLEGIRTFCENPKHRYAISTRVMEL